MKYYVVLKGHTTGIFTNRDDCKRQVDGFLGAQYKSFSTQQAAQFARKEQSFGSINGGGHKGQSSLDYLRHIMGNNFDKAICTDAACPSNPGPIEYRGVDIATGKQIFHHGPYLGGSVNIAEFLAIVEGLKYLFFCHFEGNVTKSQGLRKGMRNLLSSKTIKDIPKVLPSGRPPTTVGMTKRKDTLYSDSTVAISRVIKGRINTQITINSSNQNLFQLIDDAIQRLENNRQRSQYITLKKRPTAQRGQIPADFGRK